MGELWQELVELLRQRPLLWVPVLVADLLGYLCNLGRVATLRAFVLHQTAQHSVLGGAVMHGQLSASALRSTTVVALLLTWLSYFVRILLYAVALVVTAQLVRRAREHQREAPRDATASAAAHWGGILELSLRALAIYALAALLYSLLTQWLTRHNDTGLLHTAWLGNGALLVVLMVLAVTLPPVAVRVLAGTVPEPRMAALSQQLAISLLLLVAMLGLFVGNSRQLAQVTPAVRYPLEAVASLVVALPYVLLFVGLSVLAMSLSRRQTNEPASGSQD